MTAGTGLTTLSTEIGRGHPSYLNSVLTALEREPGFGPVAVRLLTIDQAGTGRSRAAWRLVRTAYRAGAAGGIRTAVYNRVRNRTVPEWQLRFLGAELRRRFADYHGIVLVEHPLVARILAPVCRVAYLHCEIAAPASAVIPGVWRVFVPLPETRDALVQAGADTGSVVITGLVIEPEILERAAQSYQWRLGRLESGKQLSIGFFTSGAYPDPHIRSIAAAARSCLHSWHRVIVFAGTDQRRARALRRRIPALQGLEFIVSTTRQQETARTAELLAQLDVIVAAAHERTNWAVGLGLPMFVLLPHIGPFAPLNYRFATNQGTCLPLGSPADAATLGPTISELQRTGRLKQMAESGFGRHSVTGTETICRLLLQELK